MPLLKHNDTSRIDHEAVVLDLGDLRRQGETMKQRAREEAQRILDDARAEAARLTSDAQQIGQQQGFEAGHAQGIEQGRQEGHAAALEQSNEQLAKLQEAWVNAGQQWDAERRNMVLDARQSLLELAIRIAEKVTKRVPSVDPSVVADQVAAAIEHVVRPGDVSIRIHPEDRSLVDQALPDLVQSCASAEHVKLIDDAAIERGGCIVATQRGRIDATLDTQLNRLIEALLPGRAEPTGEADSSPSEAPRTDEQA